MILSTLILSDEDTLTQLCISFYQIIFTRFQDPFCIYYHSHHHHHHNRHNRHHHFYYCYYVHFNSVLLVNQKNSLGAIYSEYPRVTRVWPSFKSQGLFIVFLQFLVMQSSAHPLVLPLRSLYC